ncbi:MAG: TRAP transporter substrate-binding protein [Paracoccus sp. (in: a-proteobacteria)]
MTHIRTAFAVALVVGGASTVAAQETLRFASFEPQQALITAQILTPWAAEVSAASNGTLNVQMFPGGTLGRDPAQQLQLVEDGVVDIAWIIPGYMPGRFQQGTVTELPFLVTDSAAGSYATWQMVEQGLFTGDYEKFKMIGVTVSPTNFVAATQEIVEPSDMAGINFRAPGPTLLAAIEALGAVPVGGITGPGAAEAMSRGLIAGTSSQWGAIETFRIDEVATHYNTIPMGATPMLVVMNLARYEALPDEARAAIDALSGAVFSERFGKTFDDANAVTRARIEGEGKARILDPDDELQARWQDAMSVATQQWIAQNEGGQAIYDAFSAALQDHPGSN